MDDSENQQIPYEVYLDHRKALDQLRNDQVKTFDRSLLTLSGGALGLSIAFTDHFIRGGTAHHSFLLWSAWAFYVGVIAANLTSYQTSSLDMEREMRKWDLHYQNKVRYRKNNRYRSITRLLNAIAFISFIIATGCLLSFTYFNYTKDAEAGTVATMEGNFQNGVTTETGISSSPPPHIPNPNATSAILPKTPGSGVPSAPPPPSPTPPVKR